MKIKLQFLVMGLIISLVLFSGCSSEEKKGDEADNSSGLLDYIGNEDGKNEKLTKDALEERLREAVKIQLKDTDNLPIGVLEEGERIDLFMEQLFSFKTEEKNLDHFDKEKIQGIIAFYFYNDEDIYGIIKENFIYIEGIYFVVNDTTIINNILQTFEQNKSTELIIPD